MLKKGIHVKFVNNNKNKKAVSDSEWLLITS